MICPKFEILGGCVPPETGPPLPKFFPSDALRSGLAFRLALVNGTGGW